MLSDQDAAGGEVAPAPESEVGGSAEAATPEGAVATLDNPNEVDALDEADEAPVVFDDLGGQSFSDAVDATIVAFDDGDIVTGKVVKIDSDEVLLDIGYKSEGVIPSRELELLADAAGVDVIGVYGVAPGKYATVPPALDHPELLLVGRRRT